MTTKYCIQASEIGFLAGYGMPFKPPKEAVERFLKRNDRAKFDEYVRRNGSPDWNTKEKFVRTNKDAIAAVKSAGDVLTNNSKDIGEAIKKSVDSKAVSHFSETEKRYLAEETRSQVFRNHGTRKENNTLERWCEESGRSAVKNNKSYRLMIHPDVVIVGKIDGLTDQGEIVEIKNRAGGKLFGEIREYEMAQCQCYLRMLDLQDGFLVEMMSDQMGTLPFSRDDDFWNRTVNNVLENIFSIE